MNLAGFPDAFVEATEYLKPNLIADYANALADKFNTFYNALPVLKADSEGLIDARLDIDASHRNRDAQRPDAHRGCCARQNVASREFASLSLIYLEQG